jgi:DNA-binding transcriptional ArsR family regulator
MRREPNTAGSRAPRRDDPTAIDEEATEALGALASEHRIAILRALAAAEEPLPFSRLRERVEMRDTGRFNYHLNELLGRFVRETDGGYELGHAGERVVVAAADLAPAAADLDPDEAPTVAHDDTSADDAGDTDDDSETCPVCGEEDCGRLIHVHLDWL